MSNYISIHTTRVGGDKHNKSCEVPKLISIHTTRVGGDFLYFMYDCLA